MLLSLKAFTTVVATTVFEVKNGAVNDARKGSTATDKFYWPYPTGWYIIQCQISAPYSYTTFQGDVNTYNEKAKIGSNMLKFNVEDLENGAYFIKISGTDKNLIQRFIISK